MTIESGLHEVDKVLPGLEQMVDCLKRGEFKRIDTPLMKRERELCQVIDMTFWERLQFLITGSLPLVIKDPRY